MSKVLNQIEQDIVEAMKKGESEVMNTLRMVKSAVKNEQINQRDKEFTDNDVVAVVKREVKKRKDSIEQFTAAGRAELADKEKQEIAMLEKYMPEQMSEEEISGIIDAVLSENNTEDFGALMKAVMSKTQGAADGSVVSRLVRAKLTSRSS